MANNVLMSTGSLYLNPETAAVLLELIDEWEDIAARPIADNWRTSAIKREERRESKVYGNCASALKAAIGRGVVRQMRSDNGNK
jgi:hypothetical protein